MEELGIRHKNQSVHFSTSVAQVTSWRGASVKEVWKESKGPYSHHGVSTYILRSGFLTKHMERIRNGPLLTFQRSEVAFVSP
jgi:hypothetical protein